jgi:hypothetical protein
MSGIGGATMAELAQRVASLTAAANVAESAGDMASAMGRKRIALLRACAASATSEINRRGNTAPGAAMASPK